MLIWALEDPAQLSEQTRIQIADSAEAVFVSAATIWELEIKRSLGRLRVEADLGEYCERSGFEELPVRFEHARAIAALPFHHRDPFDRMLIAQASVESLTIATADSEIRRYDVATVAP